MPCFTRLCADFCATATASHAYEEFTQADIDALLQVRPQLFGGSEIQAALEQTTINGTAPPIFGYDLSDRAVVTWKVADHMAEAFAEAIGLPPFMTLAKAAPVAEFRIPPRWQRAHRQDQPENYYIVLEVGNASRYVQGTLVEWKTFVTVGGDPTPRLVRFDVQAAAPGVDLLEIFNPPFGAVNWSVTDDLRKRVDRRRPGSRSQYRYSARHFAALATLATEASL